jgi:hypothetical protein
MDQFSLEIWKLSQKGYCCSQIMLRLALDAQGVENPGLVAAMAGLCHGIAQKDSACGVLSGGACLLAYAAGKGRDSQEADERLPLMLEQFSDWFGQAVGGRFGGVSCVHIAGEDEPDLQVCGGILAEAFQAIRDILAQNGLELDQPHHD